MSLDLAEPLPAPIGALGVPDTARDFLFDADVVGGDLAELLDRP